MLVLGEMAGRENGQGHRMAALTEPESPGWRGLVGLKARG